MKMIAHFLVIILLAALRSLACCREQNEIIDPKFLRQFVEPMPEMPIIKAFSQDPQSMELHPKTLTIGMYQKLWKFHPGLPFSLVYAFGQSKEKATVPGPTIEARRGIKAQIKWVNHLPSAHLLPIDKTLAMPKTQKGIPTVVHLHGGITEPESDGSAKAWFTADFREKGPAWKKQTYIYHNSQEAGNLWYHDHTIGLTRANILAGLSGFYGIRDPALEDAFNLPKDEYDKHLLICDKSFYGNGSLYLPIVGICPDIHPQWNPEYYGDVTIVNGKAWPYLNVQRRKYRFRIVNGSNARFYRLALSNGAHMVQIGSDSYYLDHPVLMQKILLAPSEGADLIIDFANTEEKEIILTNSAPCPFPNGKPIHNKNCQVMKFIIDDIKQDDSSTIPRALIPRQELRTEDSVNTRYIKMFEYENENRKTTHLLLNGFTFDDPATETPISGTTELWHIINLTDDNHPLHMHLAGFQVVADQELDRADDLLDCLQSRHPDECNIWDYAKGSSQLPRANERGWKNVYKINPSYITSLLVRFAAHDGAPFPFNASVEPGYAYHCHILDHEDNQMMRPLKILPWNEILRLNLSDSKSVGL